MRQVVLGLRREVEIEDENGTDERTKACKSMGELEKRAVTNS
jgi:hypothetical protein